MPDRLKTLILTLVPAVVLAIGAGGSPAADLPDGYWPDDRVRAVLDRTLVLRFEPDLSGLSDAERVVVDRLLAVGEIFQRLHERMLHHQALEARQRLAELHARAPSARTAGLLDLYRLFKGPIATTLDNQRVPFLPVDGEVPGRNVYPWGLEKDSLDRFLEREPDQVPLVLHLRSVVRRTAPAALVADLETLRQRPALATLHPHLEQSLVALATGKESREFYAVPYSVAFAEDLFEVYDLLMQAAAAAAPEDADFAAYLRHRARDILCDDYEAGDATWVAGSFGNLNAEIGSYETYDDSLYGVKSFFALSLLLKDQERSADLRAAISGIQAIEDSLPCARHGKIREDIPVGVYNVIADYGQCRGTNTATILPNESHITAKFGRTILLRCNVMTNPQIFAVVRDMFRAALVEAQHADLLADGGFYRTLWHEVGHYLGPKEDDRGRVLDVVLAENSDTIEELKSDLVSLFAAEALHESGYYDADRLRAVYASGIRRVLQKVKPRRSQPYQVMQLMQWNFFLEHGLLTFEDGRLVIHYDRYPDVVSAMLERVLDIQARGDKAASDAFIDEYFVWQEDLHEVVAARIRAHEKYRYQLVRYAVLGE